MKERNFYKTIVLSYLKKQEEKLILRITNLKLNKSF